MRVLGRELADPFSEFWDEVSPELGVGADDIERGLSSVFGDQGADATAPYAPRWMSLPDDDLAYHVAHELTHRLMEARGYPKTMRGAGYPPDSAEARVGEDLERRWRCTRRWRRFWSRSGSGTSSSWREWRRGLWAA